MNHSLTIRHCKTGESDTQQFDSGALAIEHLRTFNAQLREKCDNPEVLPLFERADMRLVKLKDLHERSNIPLNGGMFSPDLSHHYEVEAFE
jgi:hypothetical protein